MPVRYPSYDTNADPALHNGVWSPWIKTPEELGIGSFKNRQAVIEYNAQIFKQVNFIDESIAEDKEIYYHLKKSKCESEKYACSRKMSKT